MTPKDPFLEGTFWDKFWRPIRSRALLFTPELRGPNWGLFCPEILAFTGAFFNRSKVRSDRKVLFEPEKWPVNSR